ncbi:MAG: hypothetical protein ABI316_02555 [Casimicrobiaceae bacterium]
MSFFPASDALERFDVPIRVDYEDTDAAGVACCGNYPVDPVRWRSERIPAPLARLVPPPVISEPVSDARQPPRGLSTP